MKNVLLIGFLLTTFSAATTHAETNSGTDTSGSVQQTKLIGRQISVSGLIHISFTDENVIIESRGVMMRLLRKQVQTQTPAKLDIPGSFVELTAPLEAITQIWIPEERPPLAPKTTLS